MTMLSAIRAEGVMEDATVVVDCAMNSETSLAYTQRFLVPSLKGGDIVVMDNLSSHKGLASAKRLKRRGVTCGICRRTPGGHRA